MDVEIANEDLRELLEEGPGDSAYPAGVAKAFRKRIIDIIAAESERDLHAFRSWRLKKLSGNRAVPPEFRTTGLSGICILKRTRKDGYRWDERE